MELVLNIDQLDHSLHSPWPHTGAVFWVLRVPSAFPFRHVVPFQRSRPVALRLTPCRGQRHVVAPILALPPPAPLRAVILVPVSPRWRVYRLLAASPFHHLMFSSPHGGLWFVCSCPFRLLPSLFLILLSAHNFKAYITLACTAVHEHYMQPPRFTQPCTTTSGVWTPASRLSAWAILVCKL